MRYGLYKSLVCMSVGVIVATLVFGGCSGGFASSVNSEVSGDFHRACDEAEARIGIDFVDYGAIEKAYCSESASDPAVYIELRIANGEARKKLEALVAEQMGASNVSYDTIPPLGGHEIRRDFDTMTFDKGHMRFFSGSEKQSISVYVLFASRGKDNYLFYIG